MQQKVALDSFQARINSDKRLRAQFIKDPANTLRRHGIVLPKDAAVRLAEGVRNQTSNKSDHQVLVQLALRF